MHQFAYECEVYVHVGHAAQRHLRGSHLLTFLVTIISPATSIEFFPGPGRRTHPELKQTNVTEFCTLQKVDRERKRQTGEQWVGEINHSQCQQKGERKINVRGNIYITMSWVKLLMTALSFFYPHLDMITTCC